jgi:hypothetical protein
MVLKVALAFELQPLRNTVVHKVPTEGLVVTRHFFCSGKGSCLPACSSWSQACYTMPPALDTRVAFESQIPGALAKSALPQQELSLRAILQLSEWQGVAWLKVLYILLLALETLLWGIAMIAG